MVKRYTAEQLHGDVFYTLPDGTEFVATSDHDAIEAERDALRRKIDAVIAMLEPGDAPCDCMDDYGPDENCEHCRDRDNYGDACEWYGRATICNRIRAIVEGQS